MEKQDLLALTDEQLLVEKKKLKQSKLFHAIAIGFLVGILIFGVAAWSMAEEKQVGFLLPMLILVVFIYRMLKSPNQNHALEEVLAARNLD